MSRFRLLWAVALMAGLAIGAGCGASAGSPPAKVSSGHVVAAGRANCPADQAQDLTFTGSWVRHF